MHLIDPRQIIREMAGVDFLASGHCSVQKALEVILCPKPHMLTCLLWLLRPSLGQIWLRV